MRKKILSLPDPIVGSWPEHNYLLSMLQSEETGYDWIMNMYVQTYGSRYTVEGSFDETRLTFYPYGNQNFKTGVYDVCPMIFEFRIPREIILNKYSTFLEFVMESIDSGRYMSVMLERTALSGVYIDELAPEERLKYEYYPHAINIYGYDLERKVIHCVDHFEHGIYSKKEIPIEYFEHAFYITGLPDGVGYYESQVRLYSVESNYKHKFNKDILIQLLEEYCNPIKKIDYLYIYVTTPYEKTNNEVKFGVEAYELLIGYLERYIEDCEDTLDLRSISYLHDHKKLMRLRVEYLMEHKYIEDDIQLLDRFKELEMRTIQLSKLGIKARMSKKERHIRRIIEVIEEIKQEDRLLINELIDRLKK